MLPEEWVLSLSASSMNLSLRASAAPYIFLVVGMDKQQANLGPWSVCREAGDWWRSTNGSTAFDRGEVWNGGCGR